MNEDIMYLIKTIADKTCAAADAALKQHGLTFSQLRVLGFLASRNGSSAQRDIQRHLEVSHPTMVGLVGRLEKNGFVVSFTDEEDRRNKIVRMTEKAIRLGDDLDAGRRQASEELTRGLSEPETGELYRLLNILAKNVE